MKTFHYKFTFTEGDFCIYIGKYEDGGDTALLLYKKNGNGFTYCADITRNIDFRSCLDTNNFPEVKKLFKDMEFGEDTGFTFRSGFCQYPIYVFNLENLKKYQITDEELDEYEM